MIPAAAPPGGATTGIGGLPHLDAAHAVTFALRNMEVPAIPRLSRRSPAEGAIAQAMVGMHGITIGQYGSISVHPEQIDSLVPLSTDLHHDALVGFRTFLDLAPHELGRDHGGWVKWQFVGPVTFGLALMRAGVPMSEAFSAAVRAIRTRLQHLLDAVETALPRCRQIVVIEEPSFGDLLQPGFPIAPDTAIDLVSGALAAIETTAISGLHCCGAGDIPSQLATGPAIISLPVKPEIADAAGYLIRFMESGGHIAWGVVPTAGPITTSAERPWRQLCALWCDLVQRGADPAMLRTQAIVTPECGLAGHTPAVAQRVHAVVAEIGRRVRDQSTATRWVLGA
ncbi:MAG: hypothetical protein K8R99_11325 [Actinomycetia bacterium]|nr:hypothetical protein [Actinomycetes bacterium]